MLLQDERARRDQKRLRTRLARSGSAVDNTLETFDLDRLLNSNRLHIHDFASTRLNDEKLAIPITGPTGTGK